MLYNKSAPCAPRRRQPVGNGGNGMYPFFAMLSRMKYINRWGLMRNTRSENICEHSLEVALVAHALAAIGNKKFGRDYDPERAALLAVFHDAPEIITGDMPTPVKYHSEEIRKAYGEVEDLAVEHLVSMLPEEFREDYRKAMTMTGERDQALRPLLKAADKISAVIKCVEERRSGNRDFSKAEQTITQAIRDMKLPEADFFMEEFLPSYGLTIEEQDYTREAGLKFSESSQMVFSKVLPEKPRRRPENSRRRKKS